MFSIGFTQKGVYTMGGIHGVPVILLVMIKRPKMMMIPSQNEGMAIPAMLKVRTM